MLTDPGSCFDSVCQVRSFFKWWQTKWLWGTPKQKSMPVSSAFWSDVHFWGLFHDVSEDHSSKKMLSFVQTLNHQYALEVIASRPLGPWDLPKGFMGQNSHVTCYSSLVLGNLSLPFWSRIQATDTQKPLQGQTPPASRPSFSKCFLRAYDVPG